MGCVGGGGLSTDALALRNDELLRQPGIESGGGERMQIWRRPTELEARPPHAPCANPRLSFDNYIPLARDVAAFLLGQLRGIDQATSQDLGVKGRHHALEPWR